jgi:hypothetical protein
VKPDKRWRHPWQVVRLFRNGALIVCCSHRWELTAGWCADWRDRKYLFAGRDTDMDPYHDERRTPEGAA